MISFSSSRIECSTAVLLLLFFVAIAGEVVWAQNSLTCTNRPNPCFRRVIGCPAECPFTKPSDPKAKACFLNCNSPKCEAVCKVRKPNCDGLGSACYDPRFIGGDGVVFYFHGKKDEHFALVSDPGNLHINARFIGLRPVGRTRDFTWIQALGLVLGNKSHTFTIEAIYAENWDDNVDHFCFSYDRKSVPLPEGHLSYWKSTYGEVAVERTASRNSVLVTIEGVAQISVSAVPVTEEEDKVHSYGIPKGNCFVHLEVQFVFFGLSPDVEGVIGRTYRPDYVSNAKAGVAMAVVGGGDEYRTSSLRSADCKMCLLNPRPAARSLLVN